ncbi:MAG TPA: hypothetical protein DCR44_02920 [Acholeplasmatales bacterium]|nr:hypothetical protein [Acholeplasmatales bacterium]
MNVWVTEAGSSNTFKIEAYNASNELLETSGNITLSSAGFTNAYNNFSYKFANASKTISYIKLTYNKEASGVNMRFGSLTVEEGAPIRPDSIAVTGSTHDIATGATIQLTATASPQGSIGTVTWSSSNASIASVNGSGLVTGNAAGSATIYATSTIDSSLVGSYAVTVQNPFTISVSFDDNGTASASPTAVLSGGSSTITMVPNSGYVTSTITINSGAPINLNGATTYTIDAIAQNTTVYITFVSGIEEVVISQNLLGTVTTPPTGWTYYNITSYADTSLKMDADGDYIITKSFILQTSATFTISVKGWTYSSGSLIFYNQRGEIIATLSAFTNTQASYSFTITDITVTSVKVQFDKTTGNLGIWSINISHIIE